MKIKQIISIAIAFAMLAVSFAMVSNVKAQQLTDFDNSTSLTVAAVFPKLYNIGLYQDDLVTLVTDSQIDPLLMDYYFGFEYNYSLGSANCEFIVQAWHDFGVGQPYPPAPGDGDRNTAFEIYSDFNMAGITTTVNFPAPDLEIMSADGYVPLDTSLGTEPLGQERYQIFIPVTFGAQIRAAEYGGGAPIGPVTSIAPANSLDTTALNNAFTWDFSIRVQDSTLPAAAAVGYAEFGVYRMVSLAATGMPTGAAPPGTYCSLLPYTNIVYSSNTPYYVNVTLDTDLTSGGNTIATENVFVQNIHTEAVYNVNSYIAGTPTRLMAEDVNLYVWGANNTADPDDDFYMMPSGHGTTSAGPLSSNYFSFVTEDTTNLEWGVDIPGATLEGIYTALIIITIDGDIGLTL